MVFKAGSTVYEKSLKSSYVEKIFGNKPTLNSTCQYHLYRICEINSVLPYGTFDTKCRGVSRIFERGGPISLGSLKKRSSDFKRGGGRQMV